MAYAVTLVAHDICSVIRTGRYGRITYGVLSIHVRLMRDGAVNRQQSLLAAEIPIYQTEVNPMNWDRIEGNWKQFKGSVKTQWGKLTDDQLDIINGNRERLTGKLQEAYGISKDEAEKQLTNWQDRQKDMTAANY